MRDPAVIVMRLRVGEEQYGPVYVSVPREEYEDPLVTRDNIERAGIDALAELMDEGSL